MKSDELMMNESAHVSFFKNVLHLNMKICQAAIQFVIAIDPVANEFERYLRMNQCQHQFRKYCLNELSSCALLSVSTVTGTNMKIMKELLFGNEESITKSNANSVADESQVKDAQSASSQSHIANVDRDIYCPCTK